MSRPIGLFPALLLSGLVWVGIVTLVCAPVWITVGLWFFVKSL